MAFQAAFPRIMRPAFGPGLAAAAAAAGWWVVAGKTCVAAYQPIGAASLAASYSNLANPGTYDAAPGVAPTWASATGWGLDGATQWLTTGIDAATKPVTFVVRCITTTASYGGFPGVIGTDAIDYYRDPVTGLQTLSVRGVANVGTSSTPIPLTEDRVLAVSYSAIGAYAFYLDGSPDGDGTNNQSVIPGVNTFTIGNIANAFFFLGMIKALSIYSGILTAGEIATVSAAMAALTG